MVEVERNARFGLNADLGISGFEGLFPKFAYFVTDGSYICPWGGRIFRFKNQKSL